MRFSFCKPIIRTLYIYLATYVRIRCYFSKPKQIREKKVLETQL
jgi:hypothetical protein